MGRAVVRNVNGADVVLRGLRRDVLSSYCSLIVRDWAVTGEQPGPACAVSLCAVRGRRGSGTLLSLTPALSSPQAPLCPASPF